MKNKTVSRMLKSLLLGSAMVLMLGMTGCSTENQGETSAPVVDEESGKPAASEKEYVFVSEGNSAERINPQSGGADEESVKLRESIMNTKDELEKGEGTTYYISSLNGDNGNSGTSPEEPWENLSAYSAIRRRLKPGDSILFERGGVYRGSIILASGVTYGAYGSGPKPAIYGSEENYSGTNYYGESYWQKTEKENVWVCSEFVSFDLGTIVFDHGRAVGKRIFSKMENLEENFEFYQDDDTAKIYLYLEQDPSEAFYDIEFCVRVEVLWGRANTKDVTIDNLAVKYGGGHGIAFDTGAQNIVVKNCEIGWLGGSRHTSSVRYGNGVEFWNDCSNILVENNWVYQIYDAGLTHQGADIGGYVQSDITFRGNLVEYCSYGIEYFTGNRDKDLWKNISYENNIIRFSGYGWGVTRPEASAVSLLCGWGHQEPFNAENFVIKNNILDVSANHMVVQHYQEDMPVEFVGNTYYQREGRVAYWKGGVILTATDQATLEQGVAAMEAEPALVKFLE